MIATMLASVAGAAAASLLACVPGLHVYQLMGFVVVGVHALSAHTVAVPPAVLAPFMIGLVVGHAMGNTVPSVLLAAPDESALFTVLPGQKYLMQGRGYEAVMLTATGGLAGLFVLTLVFAPLAPRLLPGLRAIFDPHLHWMLWCIIGYMLMSEWPKGGNTGPAGLARLRDGWRSTGAGLFTFVLSGLLGFVLLYRSPVSSEAAFQNLMPAFVGLFTLPWLVLNIFSRTLAPAQTISGALDIRPGAVFRGVVAGSLGGGLAAFMPVVTGGVGGFLAGQATAVRDDRVFLISQGTSKLIYYAGGLLMLFVPGLQATRGGGAWLLKSLYSPSDYPDYHMALASTALAGAVAFLLVSPTSRVMIRLIRRFDYRRLSCIALCVTVGIVPIVTGVAGAFVMLVAAGIGLIPVLHGSRRMNCLGVILLPLACGMSGVGATVAGWLGLM